MGMSSLGAAAAIMARIKEGLGSEAPIAPKLHKRPRRRRAKQVVVYGVSMEWTGKGLGAYIHFAEGFKGELGYDWCLHIRQFFCLMLSVGSFGVSIRIIQSIQL